MSPDDGMLIPTALDSGDVYLQMENRSRYRMISIEKEFNEVANHALHFFQLRKVQAELQAYKSATNKFDFADLIEKYVMIGIRLTSICLLLTRHRI